MESLLTDQRVEDRRYRVVHVDDDLAFASMTKEFLESLHDAVEVVTTDDPNEALARLESGDVDCIVSDFDMPTLDGLEFLHLVREHDPDAPFILFTGKGSEEIASDAISAGVTDYLQKEVGTGQYEVLLNRIVQAVDKRRTERELERRLTAIEAAHDGIGILDADGEYVYMNRAYANVYGYRPADLIGVHWKELYPDEEVNRFNDRILPQLETEGHWHGTSVGVSRNGAKVPEELSLAMLDDGGHVCVLKEREEVTLNTDVSAAISRLWECIDERSSAVDPDVLDAVTDALDALEAQLAETID